MPDYLKNQERYIFAVVEIGNTSYDLREKTITQAKDDAANGDILFGQTTSTVKLTSGGRISNIEFEGQAEGEPAKIIYFTMADTYISGESELPIPDGKEVTFYCVTDGIGDTFSTDAHMFHGTTGSTKITKAMLPETLVGPNCYFYAVVNLDGFYDLRGKTRDDVRKAVFSGKVLFGKSVVYVGSDDLKEYRLSHDINIDNFVFHGPIPDGVINFVMPSYCVSGTPIPSGKPVKFYSVTELDDIIDADEHVFTGTTGDGGTIQLTLPGWLIGQGRFFVAVVNLKGSFDLQGKRFEQVIAAVQKGDILYGESCNPNSSDELYTLADGIFIDNFEFFDRDNGSETSFINFMMPNVYLGPPSEPGAGDNPEYQIPGGRPLHFYAITEENYSILDNEDGTMDDVPVNVQHILSKTTAETPTMYQAPLLSDLIGEKRHFVAVVDVDGTFTDLQGMTKRQLTNALLNGSILWGKSLKSGSGVLELYTIEEGTNIVGNFEFIGVVK